MTFDPSVAVSSAIDENPDAVEMILNETEHKEKAREFLLEQTREQLSGNINQSTTECELKTQLRELDS